MMSLLCCAYHLEYSEYREGKMHIHSLTYILYTLFKKSFKRFFSSVERTLFQAAIRFCKHIKVLSTAQNKYKHCLCTIWQIYTVYCKMYSFFLWWSLLLTSIIKAFALFILLLFLLIGLSLCTLFFFLNVQMCICILSTMKKKLTVNVKMINI